MKQGLSIKAIALAGVLTTLMASCQLPAFAQSDLEISITELHQMDRATAMAQRFLAVANRGDLRTAKTLCTKKQEPSTPSTGDLAWISELRNNRVFRKTWATRGFRIIRVAYQRAQSKNGPYIYV